MNDKQHARRVAAAHERLIATIDRCATLLKEAEDSLATEVASARVAGISVTGPLIPEGDFEGHNFASDGLSKHTRSVRYRVSRTVELAEQPLKSAAS